MGLDRGCKMWQRSDGGSAQHPLDFLSVIPTMPPNLPQRFHYTLLPPKVPVVTV